MIPFPATLHGEPVRVYHFTEDRLACIALANGRLDYVPATSLVVVSVQAEPTPIAAPRSSWEEEDLLAESIEIATILGVDRDVDYDIIPVARERMAEITRLRAEIAELRGER